MKTPKRKDEYTVIDDDGIEVQWYDDDYVYWEEENDRLSDPLDDDYNKYDNE